MNINDINIESMFDDFIKTDQVVTKTDQVVTKTEQVVTKTEQVVTKTEQFVTKTEQKPIKIERQHAIALFAYTILHTKADIKKGEITISKESQKDYLLSLLEHIKYRQLEIEGILYYDSFKKLFDDVSEELFSDINDKKCIYDPAECLIVIGDYHNIWKINYDEKGHAYLGILSVTCLI